jgi:hypothetical protein
MTLSIDFPQPVFVWPWHQRKTMSTHCSNELFTYNNDSRITIEADREPQYSFQLLRGVLRLVNFCNDFNHVVNEKFVVKQVLVNEIMSV